MRTNYDDFDEIDQRIMSARSSAIAKMDAATDFNALLSDIYTKAASAALQPRTNPRRSTEESRDTGSTTAQIDMLDAVITAALSSSERSPLLGATYLTAARTSLRRLGRELAARRLGKGEALRLIGHIEHNLQEADHVLRAELGLSLGEALHRRIGELAELGQDLEQQMRVLRRRVEQLFEDANEPQVLAPSPRG